MYISGHYVLKQVTFNLGFADLKVCTISPSFSVSLELFRMGPLVAARLRSNCVLFVVSVAFLVLAGCGSAGSGGGWGDLKPSISSSGSSSGQPASKVVVAGQPVTFDVTAAGTGPMTFQWYANGKPIAGATGSSYTISTTTADENGEVFTVAVTNAAGTVTSAAATLTVHIPAVIVTQPQNETVPAGQTATFTAAATGTAPLQYQWYQDKTAINGATAASYTTPVTAVGNSGASYSVSVSNVVNTAGSKNAILTVTPLTPALAFAPVSTKIYGSAAFAISASSASAGAVSYSVVSGPATLAGNTVSVTGTGTVVLAARQAAAGNYAAATVTTSFLVNPATPTLIFTQPPAATYTYGAAAFPIVASSVSNGAVHYTVTGPAAIAGNVISLTGTGSVIVTATQDATADYQASTTSTTFVVNPATSTLTFTQAPAATYTYGATPFAVTASSISTGAIHYTVIGPATIAGNVITLTGTGAVTVTATQDATADYKASSVGASFQINPATPTLTFTQAPAATYTYGATPFAVTASSISTGAIHYTVIGPATIAGNVITLTGTGAVTVTATQDATADYKASSVSASFQINPATPTLTFTQAPAASYTYGATPFAVTASSISTGAIHCTVTGPATIAGNVITLTGTGAVIVTATQDATANYKASSVSASFQINPATPTLTFTSAPSGSISFSPSAFPVTAQSNSTGAITYSVVSGPATISGNQLQLTGAGTVEIEASVAAAGNYGAAAVTRTFGVTTISPGLQLTAPGAPTTFTATPFSVSTSSNSQGAITYSILSGPATISANGTVTLTGAGPVVIQASQAAAGGYAAATTTVTVTTALNMQIGAISPASETVAPGTISFSDTVTGGVTDAINWTASGGTINSAGVWTAPNTAGTYTITATSAEDSSKSASVTITISAPVIQTQPVSQSICGSGAISLSVTAEYASSYLWYLNNSAISGATSATYVVAGSSSTAGSYTVAVTNGAGTVTSQPATVQVGSSITSQPASLTISEGQTAAFSVAASGKGPFTYQWYSAATSTAITGATSSTYITPVQMSLGSSSFYVTVTDSCGTAVQSSTANLTVNTGNAPPTITVQPLGQTISAGGTATFSVTAVGSGTLSYQWYRIPNGGVNGEITGSAPVTGTIVSGATSSSYTLPTANAAKGNDQDQYYVIVSNSFGQAVSQNATLAVNQGIQIQIKDQPVNVYVNPGASATFSVTATSTVPLSYQWYMVPPGESAAAQNITIWDSSLTPTTTTANAVPIDGATESTYTVPAAALNQNGTVYYVAVSNGGLTSAVISNAASLFVGTPSNIPSCSSNWNMQGTDVSYNSGTCAYTLTTSDTDEFGEIIWPNLISTGNLKLSFTIATSGTSSTPADGFAMVLGDPSLGATLQSAGQAGEGLGARGIPGFVLAFDDFFNPACTGSTCFPAPYPADPSTSGNPDYLGVGRGEDVLWENPYFNVNTSIPLIAQSNATKSHTYVVNITQGYMSVSMDGLQIFSGHVSVPPVAYLYVTASTGGSFEKTVISNISGTVAAPSN